MSLHLLPFALRWRVVRGLFGLAGLAMAARGGRAETLDTLSGVFADKLGTIDTALRRGRWELYVTGYAWHLPWAYDAATRARLNETTWGGGFGRSVQDDDGDRHSVFVMGFADSHRATQFIASYGWQRYWRATPDWSIGGGYLAFLFAREDVKHYLPLPAALPCASVRFRKWELTGLFVPHVSRDIKGDVFFLFLRVALGGE